MISSVIFLPSAIVLALPPDWKHRSSKSNQNASVGQRANPILDPTRTVKHTTNNGRLPQRSDSGPQSIGAIQEISDVRLHEICKLTYRVLGTLDTQSQSD